ncbi:lysosomal phospholipase A and acyltransferase-like [Watersipora subatra]|uniref:lysosomal phospholipase A and acyltransferase-like n=1 Tax=Watersipora subatra TaxID=2589382 RepID=UPI00355ADF56
MAETFHLQQFIYVIIALFIGIPSCLSYHKKIHKSPNSLTPVVLVPGDGGSQMLAKLAKPDVPHYFCSDHTDDYFALWLNLELLAPYILDCTVDNLRLVYDPVTKTTANRPGVYTVVPNFGDPVPVEFLDPSRIFVSSYFAPLANALRSAGYENNRNLFGTGYDFRKAPNEMQELYANMTALFEHSYDLNQKPALVVAHSLGNMVFVHFMSTKSQSWKDKYVSGYVALSAPLGGAAKLFRLFVSGDTLGERFISAISVRPMQRTFPSSAFLLPYATEHFWPTNYPFIITPQRNYSATDIDALAEDMDYPDMTSMWRATKDLVDVKTMHPGVPIYCIHGWNLSTPLQFTYTGSMFPDSSPYVTYGQGDGTVNDVSLLGCDLWNTGKWPFDHQYVSESGGEHMKILANKKFVNYVKGILGLKL